MVAAAVVEVVVAAAVVVVVAVVMAVVVVVAEKKSATFLLVLFFDSGEEGDGAVSWGDCGGRELCAVCGERGVGVEGEGLKKDAMLLLLAGGLHSQCRLVSLTASCSARMLRMGWSSWSVPHRKKMGPPRTSLATRFNRSTHALTSCSDSTLSHPWRL